MASWVRSLKEGFDCADEAPEKLIDLAAIRWILAPNALIFNVHVAILLM